MAPRISIKQQRKEAPQWVFNWRRVGNHSLAKWVAVLVTGGLFALLMSVVRIRVYQPVAWAAPKAGVIHVGDDAVGRALTQRAREGGPFPSRFLPSRWEGGAALEQAVLDATRWTPPPYVPSLKELPDVPPAPPRLAARGEPVLPIRRLEPADAPAPVKLALSPVIYPLSGIRDEDIPAGLPPFGGGVDAKLASSMPSLFPAWRFLIRLSSDGSVRDCVALDDSSDRVTAWLRRVTFKPEPGTPVRWIAVGVAFTNQPAADGTDAR